VLVFPVRIVREVPIVLAERFAALAVDRRSLVAAYLFGLFLVVPLLAIFLIP
jgi:hypothetical protein